LADHGEVFFQLRMVRNNAPSLCLLFLVLTLIYDSFTLCIGPSQLSQGLFLRIELILTVTEKSMMFPHFGKASGNFALLLSNRHQRWYQHFALRLGRIKWHASSWCDNIRPSWSSGLDLIVAFNCGWISRLPHSLDTPLSLSLFFHGQFFLASIITLGF
jgi:hypothetical protein